MKVDKLSIEGELYGYQKNASLSHTNVYYFLHIPITHSKHGYGYVDFININTADLFCLFLPFWYETFLSTIIFYSAFTTIYPLYLYIL